MSKRPHIIIFNPDEMRYDTMGHMGNPAAVTPFIDQFVNREAVSFSNAYCQNPVCVPSRCSFFTGLYPHVHGHRTMSHLLHRGEENLFSELKANGYHVWMNSRNDLLAGQDEAWVKENADVIFYGGAVPNAPGHINKLDNKSLGGKDLYSHFEGELGLDEKGQNYNADDETVDAAITYAKEYKGDQPICMFLGLMFPHTPYGVEEPYFSGIDRKKLPSRILPESCIGKSKMLEEIRKYQKMDQYSEEDWDELRAVYLGMCTKVDNQFKRLCDGLKEAGIYDDSAIFFLSDHGDFAGDYGLAEKAQNTFEDCLTRVPLLIKPPKGMKVDAGVSDSMAELIDFYATVMDYAEVIPERTHFGRSLKSIVEDRSESVREYAFCEGGRLPGEDHCDEYHSANPPETFVYYPKMKAQTNDEAHCKATMIRSTEYKYVSRSLGSDEFYDLKKDPQERYNCIDQERYAAEIVKMQIAMMKWYQNTCDVVPYEYDKRFTNEMLWAKVKNICPKEYEDDVKEKIASGMKMGIVMQYIAKLPGEQ